MKLEFLVVVESGNSFCSNVESFKNFLQSDSDIKISSKKILHKDYEVLFELQDGCNEEKGNKFYHLRLKCQSEKVGELACLGRAIKKMLHKCSNNVQVLWDDVSFHYSQKSYPLIHEIENLMRKLITKFMLTNVGLGWAKDTVPEEVKKNARVEAGEVSSNYLYEVDFIQLSNFLFNEYRTLDLNALAKKISEVEGDSIPLKEISDFIPLSNWSRYFQPHVDCEAQYLQVRWEKLYKLRCKIAHNNSFSRSDYDQTAALYSEVKGKLEKAIESLDEIAVPEEEREELAERAASQTNIMLAAYLAKWRLVEDLVDKVLHSNGYYSGVSGPNKKKTLFGRHSELIKHGLIGAQDYKALREALVVRNALVHDNSQYFGEIDIVWYMKRLDELIELLASLIKD